MAVSPSDFALYSRVTGRSIPTDRGARMKMAPEVSRFIRNREYERPQKTALQKGADLLGKAAMIGGTLAAAHAIGGGFKGQTAEKVADVVENMAKTGDVGEKGGNEVINRVLNRTGRDLDSLDDFGGNIPPNIGGGDTILPKKPDGSAQIVNTADEVDAWLAKNQWIRSDAGITGKGHGNIGQEKEWLKEELDARKELETGLTSEQRQQNYINTLGADEEKAERNWWNLQLDAMARDRDPDGPPPGGGGGGGGPISPVEPDEGGFRGPYVRDDQLATTSDSSIQQKVGKFLGGQRQWGINTLDAISRQGGGRDLRQSAPVLGGAIAGRGLIPGTGGGLLPGSGTSLGRNAVSGFWDAAGNFVRRDPIVDGAVRGLEGLGNMNVFGHSVADAAGSAFNAVPGLSDAVNLGGVKLAELGLLGGGVVLDSAVKDTLKLGVDARRFAENRFGFRPLSWQETAVQTGNLLDQGWSRDAAAKVAARNNPLLAEGMSRHDEAMDSLQKNIQAVLPTTRFTGQVAIGENAQLNRHPDRPPGETDTAPSRLIQQDEPAIAPARLIQQFSDKGLLGEGSLTPDDLEIRTDVDVSDPVNFTQLFGKRVGRGEKAKFISGLKERNKDVYSGASDLPKRKEGTGFKWEDGKRGTGGSAGQAATLSGAINYTSPDDRPKNPLQAGFDALREGYQEASAAEEVGRRMAEREEQGSTEWVRSPDGKLRRKKIDDPWE